MRTRFVPPIGWATIRRILAFAVGSAALLGGCAEDGVIGRFQLIVLKNAEADVGRVLD